MSLSYPRFSFKVDLYSRYICIEKKITPGVLDNIMCQTSYITPVQDLLWGLEIFCTDRQHRCNFFDTDTISKVHTLPFLPVMKLLCKKNLWSLLHIKLVGRSLKPFIELYLRGKPRYFKIKWYLGSMPLEQLILIGINTIHADWCQKIMCSTVKNHVNIIFCNSCAVEKSCSLYTRLPKFDSSFQ